MLRNRCAVGLLASGLVGCTANTHTLQFVKQNDSELRVAFPLAVGAIWTYAMEVSTGSETSPRPSWSGCVTLKVTDASIVKPGETLFRVDITITPEPPTAAWLTARSQTYRLSPEELQRDDLTILKRPLQVGSSWPIFPDSSYRWRITGKRGFILDNRGQRECLELQLHTLPDSSTEWYCPGIGPTRRHLVHHGERQTQRWELTDFRPGPVGLDSPASSGFHTPSRCTPASPPD